MVNLHNMEYVHQLMLYIDSNTVQKSVRFIGYND